MRRVVWGIALLMVLGSQPVWAARTRVHQAAESQQYGRKFGGMLGRGALNIVTSFVDVIVNVVNETKAGPPFLGTLTGVAKGTGCGVLRLGSGAIDIATSWVPGFNGFPVSDSYEDCLANGRSSVSIMEPEPSYTQSASTWEAPTAEPEAVETLIPLEPAPAIQEAPAPRKWKK